MKKILEFIGYIIWMSAEFFGINLGKFAPIVFGWMLGQSGKRIK